MKQGESQHETSEVLKCHLIPKENTSVIQNVQNLPPSRTKID